MGQKVLSRRWEHSTSPKSDSDMHPAQQQPYSTRGSDLEHDITSEEDLNALRNDYAQFDLSLVECARLHGLTSNYLSHNPLDSDLIPGPPADWQADLEEPEDTLNIGVLVTLGALNGHTAHEKLDIDKKAAELLASVIKLVEEDDSLDKWQHEYSTRF